MKKGKKRFLAMILAAVMAVGCLAGCGNNEETKKSSSQAESSKESQSSEVKSSEAQSSEAASSSEADKHPITTEPVTISILTSRNSPANNDAEDIWFFNYLEWWLNQQGYNVTLDVSQTTEAGQQISLMLGTDTLPDIVWGIGLSPSQAVTYGMEDQMILDWTPYINEETMPNLYASLQKNQDALLASTLPDGKVYGLPHIKYRGHMENSGSYGGAMRLFINQKWLDACDLEVPTDIDGFLNMLRTFKEEIKLEDGKEVIPCVPNQARLERYFYMSLGYYGNDISKYGLYMSIKDGEITLPAATEDFRTVMTLMNTIYEEGLISPDYPTMDSKTARGLMADGVCGVVGDYGLQYVPEGTFQDWVSAKVMTIGDNDEVVSSVAPAYVANTLWASADTKYPEIVALIADYIYSPEGATYYLWGPPEGKDPLNMVDGWYFDENGNVMTKMVADGTVAMMTDYCAMYIYGNMYMADASLCNQYMKEVAGLDSTQKIHMLTDVVTGKQYETVQVNNYVHEEVDGHQRIMTYEEQSPYASLVFLPAVYMSEEDSLRAAELQTVIETYVKAEYGKFLVGIRPLSEMDDYFAELKAMGVDEYIELYRKAYSTFMDGIYK